MAEVCSEQVLSFRWRTERFKSGGEEHHRGCSCLGGRSSCGLIRLVFPRHRVCWGLVSLVMNDCHLFWERKSSEKFSDKSSITNGPSFDSKEASFLPNGSMWMCDEKNIFGVSVNVDLFSLSQCQCCDKCTKFCLLRCSTLGEALCCKDCVWGHYCAGCMAVSISPSCWAVVHKESEVKWGERLILQSISGT